MDECYKTGKGSGTGEGLLNEITTNSDRVYFTMLFDTYWPQRNEGNVSIFLKQQSKDRTSYNLQNKSDSRQSFSRITDEDGSCPFFQCGKFDMILTTVFIFQPLYRSMWGRLKMFFTIYTLNHVIKGLADYYISLLNVYCRIYILHVISPC